MLKTVCSPILNLFENQSEAFVVKPLNRKIVLAIGLLMTGLALLVLYMAWPDNLGSYFLAPLVFGSVGVTALIVGCLGSDKAVAKLLGSR